MFSNCVVAKMFDRLYARGCKGLGWGWAGGWWWRHFVGFFSSSFSAAAAAAAALCFLLLFCCCCCCCCLFFLHAAAQHWQLRRHVTFLWGSWAGEAQAERVEPVCLRLCLCLCVCVFGIVLVVALASFFLWRVATLTFVLTFAAPLMPQLATRPLQWLIA